MMTAERGFADLDSAGRRLALVLASHRRTNPVVLAIANGGVPIAIPVADSLAAPLEVLVVRRLFIRDGSPVPICAVSIGGELVLDEDSRPLSAIEEQFQEEALAGLSRRAQFLRRNLTVTNLGGQNVILVDNGIHTGSTMKIAIAALRKLQPRTITVAVPVADVATRESIESVADEVVCLQWCEQFGHTGLWYKNFNRPSDEQIRAWLSAIPAND